MSKELAIAEVRILANSAIASGLASSVRNKEAMFTMMMIAQAEGIAPIQAMNCYDIIQGRLALKAHEVLARFNDRGGRVKWLENTRDKAKAIFTSKYNEQVEYEYTIEDAEDAGLANKDNWKKNRKAMLRARCQVGGVRMSDPRALNNMYSSDEVRDFTTEEIEDNSIPEVEIIEEQDTGALKRQLWNKLKKLNVTDTDAKDFFDKYKELLEELVNDEELFNTKLKEFEDDN